VTSLKSSAPAVSRGWLPTLGLLAGQLLTAWAVILALMIGVGLALTGPLADVWPLTVEDNVSTALERGRTPLGDTLSQWASALGNTTTIVPLCLVCMLALRWVLHRWREAIMVGCATLGQSVVFLCTTLAIDRERPDVEHLDPAPPTSSFPSGHTSASLALYLSLALVVHERVRERWVRRGLMVVLAMLPIAVALGRLYRGMHHPSDIAGAVLNAGLVLVATFMVVRRMRLPDDEGQASQ
jgi:membrane-associated phospholipid phosphatase